VLVELKDSGLKGTGNIRENRTGKCPLINSTDMKKRPRGAFDSKVDKDLNIMMCKWNDNSVVTIASNSCSIEPIRQVKRYSRKEKKNVYIDQRKIIKIYNANVGGMDRSDQNISLVRTSIRGKKKQGRVIFVEIISRTKKKQQTTAIYYFSLNYKMNCQMCQEKRKILAIVNKKK
jgi:hypothetical protein